jgi:alpha-tubulin suppressor-like RCC1 family protein
MRTRHLVFLTVGSLGTNAGLPTRVQQPVTFAAVSAGASHTCALTTGGRAYCWGLNTEGELGTGVRIDALVPTPVAGSINFLSIDAGIQFTCGVSETGTAYCWGDNHNGQLGNAATPHSLTPVPVTGGLRFRTVTVGGDYACGVSEDGAAYCWGLNHDGQLGTGDTLPSARPLPVALGLRFLAITAGDAHTCAIGVDSTAYCWGNNLFGQLGIGKRGTFLVPQPVLHHRRWLMLSAGGRHTCGVAAGRRITAYCWGDNFHGQAQPIGAGRVTPAGSSRWPGGSLCGMVGCFRVAPPVATFMPVFIDDRLDILGITAGRRHTCLYRHHPTLAVDCWGDNLDDQLGRNVIGSYRQASAGDAHTCALREDGAIYCWGRNASGQLGNGTLSNDRLPARVSEPIALRP